MEKERKRPLLSIQRSRRAADNFLRTAERKRNRDAGGEESGWDLHDRFSHMSDEDFDKGVADGTITKDQIRKAGQEAYENYMLDVWSEQDDNDLMPWPSYEEFYENPEKYGYDASQHDYEGTDYPDRFYRYKPSRYTSEGGGGR